MKATPQPPSGTPESVGAALERALSTILRWSSRPDVRRSLLGAETSLSPTDAWLLERIAEAGPVRLSDLAAWQGVDKSTMTPQAQRLMRQQLVERTQDPSDGRAVLLTITKRGKAVRSARQAAARRILDDLVSDWSERDQAHLARLLERLAQQLRVAPSQYAPDESSQ